MNNNEVLIIRKKFQILEKYTNYSVITIDPLISIEELLNKLQYYKLLTYSIILGEIDKIYKKKIKDEIESIKDKILLTPKNLFRNLKEVLIDLSSIKEKSILISEEFYNIHKIQCMLENTNILLYFFKKTSFILKYLEIFILKNKLYTKVGFLAKNNEIYYSIEKAMNDLKKNGWILEEKKIIKKINIKIIDKKKCISYCNCNYVTNLEEFHLPIEEKEHSYKIVKKIMEKRQLNLSFKTPQNIRNPMAFYKSKVLKCVDIAYSNTNNKLVIIKTTNLKNELNLVY